MGEAKKHTDFWPVAMPWWLGLLRLKAPAGQSEAGWLADVHYCPPHMQMPALRANYSHWKRNALYNLPPPTFPLSPNKTKQFLPHCFKELRHTGKSPYEQRIIFMVCMWFMQLILISAVACFLLFRGELPFEALGIKNQEILDDQMAHAHWDHAEYQIPCRYTSRCWPIEDLANFQ